MFYNICPSRLERYIYLKQAIDEVKKIMKGEGTWKDEYDELCNEFLEESHKLHCRDFTVYLELAKVITQICDDIEIKEPRHACLKNTLREKAQKISKQALLILVKENGNHCVTLDARSERDWKIYDRQVEKTLEIKDLDLDSVNRVQVITTVDEELKLWEKHCGKHLCSKDKNKVERLPFSDDGTCLIRR